MTGQRIIAVQMDIDKAYKRHTSVFAGIHNYARTKGNWRLVVDEWAHYTLPARGDKPAPYDGLVGRIPAQGANRARRLGMPIVNVWFNSPAQDLPSVYPDYVACGHVQAEHLISRGFQNFGSVCRQSHRFGVVQARAFETYIRDYGFSEIHALCLHSQPDQVGELSVSHSDWQRDVRAIERWLNLFTPPVGLYIFETGIARVIIELCINRGWRVPEDVAIIAGTNEETLCERPSPSITSLEFPDEQVGFEAAHLLDRLIDEQDDINRTKKRGGSPAKKSTKHRAPFAKHILLPPVGIVARRSTDFYAVDDPLVRQALRYIDDNLHRNITIDKIAAALEVSRRTITNRFRDQLQRTVAAEIQRLRIERIKRGLAASDQPIKQLAVQAGYGSTRTLNDAFRQIVGCTPRQYRQRRSVPPPARWASD